MLHRTYVSIEIDVLGVAPRCNGSIRCNTVVDAIN